MTLLCASIMSLPYSTAGNEMDDGGALADFLAMTEARQLTIIKRLNRENLQTLHDQLITHAILHPQPVTIVVLTAILWTCDPKDYDDREQPTDLRKKLTPKSLAAMRAGTYESVVRPLIHFSTEKQESYAKSLDDEDRKALLKLIDRYAREYGRSASVRSLEDLIRSV
jgi:hypothetical protein